MFVTAMWGRHSVSGVSSTHVDSPSLRVSLFNSFTLRFLVSSYDPFVEILVESDSSVNNL